MALVDYTSHDEVRAALGVTSDELSDATIDLDMFDHGLSAEIEDVNSALPAAFATVALIEPATRTTTEAALFRAVKLFSPYAVGMQLASGLPMFGPKDITDGKAGVTRFSTDPYKAALAACKALYERYRQMLVDAWAAYNSDTATDTIRTFFIASSPSSDPVTGT